MSGSPRTASGRGSGGGRGLRRLGAPRPASVRSGRDGLPAAVGHAAVEAVVEDWVVEEGWWTGRPLRRRYFELALADGRRTVVFRDVVSGCWYVQRAA